MCDLIQSKLDGLDVTKLGLPALKVYGDQVTASCHSTGIYVGPHQDDRPDPSCLYKLAICGAVPETQGRTLFYEPSNCKTSRNVQRKVQHREGQAVLFDLELWHSGEPEATGTKMLVGVKICVKE